ncbi:serine/threonine-protein kinase [Flammeovirga aprica]|uniref:Serine/threonine protein kinase n=1 Tax=Flammeovirga aprica JL-4 TaxID=694437 RepID=A0A7X9P223_9BACT|nr:serine/threonine-protein kinase [Flammeovirga aprica]NME67865.1 serine/threonine protein kinase [Flammeovirga aprica JL-4]
MSDNLHEKATALFGQVIDLSENQGRAFIEKETEKDSELREYTLKLYLSFLKEQENFGNHEPQKEEVTKREIAPYNTVAQRSLNLVEKIRQVPKKKNTLIIVILLLFISTFYVYATYIRNQLKEMEVNEHIAILKANKTILNQWVENQKMKVKDIASSSLVQNATLQLTALYDKDGSDFYRSDTVTLRSITKKLSRLSKNENILGIGIIHKSIPMTLISTGVLDQKSKLSLFNGKLLAEGAYPVYVKVIGGNTVFFPPIELDKQVYHEHQLQDEYVSECHFATPIIIDDKIEGVFNMSLVSKKTFGKLFRSTIHGNSSEVYAINKRGQMLTTSRFLKELQQSEMLDFDTTKSSILNIDLKVPNGNEQTALYADIHKDLDSPSPQFSGTLTEPYINYLGNKVIGAWVWFPEYQIGLIHEQNYSEFNRSIYLFDITFLLIVVIAVILGMIVIRSNFKLHILRKKYTELQELGQYQLIEKIGEGGFGKVYKGEHRLLKKPVAIKLLKKELNGTDALDRFKKEVMVMASLDHPNTMKVYDYGTSEDGQFYYVMEYLNGISVESMLGTKHAITINRGIHILLKVCRSLEEAHLKGLLHRDIKPANIMICNQGGAYDIIKLLDFGLVKEMNTSVSQQTKINRIGGTPMFMAPERLHDPYNADARQDIYAIGAVGLYMFSGKYIVELISQKMLMGQDSIDNLLTEDIFKEVSLPQKLIHLLFSCISFNVEERPENIRSLIEALEDLSQEYPWSEQQAKEWWKEFDQYS